MLMGVFIFSIWFVGFVCGALFMRFCARRGVGEMSLCNGCRYKNLWAQATAEIAGEELDSQDHDDYEEVQRCVKDLYISSVDDDDDEGTLTDENDLSTYMCEDCCHYTEDKRLNPCPGCETPKNGFR